MSGASVNWSTVMDMIVYTLELWLQQCHLGCYCNKSRTYVMPDKYCNCHVITCCICVSGWNFVLTSVDPRPRLDNQCVSDFFTNPWPSTSKLELDWIASDSHANECYFVMLMFSVWQWIIGHMGIMWPDTAYLCKVERLNMLNSRIMLWEWHSMADVCLRTNSC